VAVIALVVLAGCGSAAKPPPPQPALLPEAVDGCDGAGTGWKRFMVRSDGPLEGAVLGDGATAVVLANESGNRTCPWMPLATDLARHGDRVVTFEYFDKDKAARELLDEAAALRRAGVRRVALVGASLGGRAVVQAAADPRLAAAVSLSAERSIGTYPDLLPAAEHVRTPSLYVTAKDDGFTNFGHDTRRLHAATPSSRLLIVKGGDHGTDMLPGIDGAIRRFIQAHP
jgi:pimeloyl-ACP methyl ester carboxylesterase